MDIDYERVILGTSNYDNAKTGNLVSITGDGGNAWGFFGKSYKKIAPLLKTYTPYADELEKLKQMKDDIESYKIYKKMIEDKYIESFYETRLDSLNVYELLEILYKKYGYDIILLCHEPIDEFCHRRLLADYIEMKTGMYIPEIKVVDNDIIKLNPIRYKNRIKKVMERQ